jgi:adenylyltransferase/sulfurtransferase
MMAGELTAGLDQTELRRFSRQLLLPEMSGAAQARLRAAEIAVAGTDGAAFACALYLAAAGVGALVTEVDTTLARALAPELRVSPSGDARDGAARPTSAASGPAALVYGAFAAIETAKRLLGLGKPARAPFALP